MSNIEPVSVDYAAAELRITPRAVRHRIKRGTLAAVKVGGGQTSAYVLDRAEVARAKAEGATA